MKKATVYHVNDSQWIQKKMYVLFGFHETYYSAEGWYKGNLWYIYIYIYYHCYLHILKHHSKNNGKQSVYDTKYNHITPRIIIYPMLCTLKRKIMEHPINFWCNARVHNIYFNVSAMTIFCQVSYALSRWKCRRISSHHTYMHLYKLPCT